MVVPWSVGALRDRLGLTRVVLEGEGYVVVDKPAGVLSVPGKAMDNKVCVLDWVRAAYPRARGPMVVHRLDMDTSGLLVVALGEDTQRILSAQFEARHVEKAYVAVVEGHVAAETGTVSLPVRADYANRPYQIVDRSHSRPAITAWQVLAYEPDRTRLRLVPHTGRTHQLRVHCAFAGEGGMSGAGRGHPIVGDVLYGSGTGADRLHLHAAELVFSDPRTGRRTSAKSPAPF